jgi:hypothetical protein
VWTALLVLAAAGGAEAQTAPMKLDLAALQASGPVDLSVVRSPTRLTDAQAEALRAGIAQTAVDHRFADRLTGSLGFLCDPHPSMQFDGLAARPGADPQGKFLGAKLSFAFR